MTEHDAQMACAHESSRFYIVHGAVTGKLRTHHAGKAGDEGHTQRQDDIIFTKAQHGDEHQGDQNIGEGGEGIVDAHQDLVHHAAEIARESTDDDAHHAADQNGAGGDEEGRTDTHHRAGENITPEVVRTEQVAKRGG